jgi:hypothetical protein
MLNRLVSILLGVALLACPLLCGAASVDAADVDAEPAKCSCCCHSTDTPTTPGEECPEPDGCCQCVCGGAIVEHAAEVQIDLCTGFWSPPPATSLIPAMGISKRALAIADLQPDNGTNPGRAKCCLFMTFLC